MPEHREPQPSFLLPARLFGALTGVRSGERRATLAAFLTLVAFMAGHALLETARDALFLANWPASALPWAYLAIAGLALLVSRKPPRLPWSHRSRSDLGAWLVLAGVVTGALWVVLGFAGDWVYYGLYIWSGVLATLVVVRFWTVLADRFTVTQAKRLFAVIGVGSVLGAIFGSGLARVLTEMLVTRHLVLAAALLFGAASFGPRFLGEPVRGETEEKIPEPGRRVQWEATEAARLILSRPYLLRVAALILCATVTFTLADYVFKSTVDRFVAGEDLGEFFASVYFSLNILSLLVQAVVVSWLLRRFGVGPVQALAPVALLVAALGYVALPGLGVALLLKAADGSLRHSLYRTATELLFVPMSVDVRGRVKAVIDVIGQRGGQALASLVILAVLTVTTAEAAIAFVAASVAGLWVVLALDLRGHYVGVFRETLRERITRTRIDFPALDVASLEALLSTLNEPDDRKVLAALELLEVQGKVNVIPALILYHPSPQVVGRALEAFVRGRREDVVPIVDRLLLAGEPGVAAAALRARCVLQPDEGPLRRALEHPSPRVRATAIVGMVAGGWTPPGAARQLAESVLDDDEEVELELLRTLRALPSPAFDDVLNRLAASGSATVRREAVRAMGEIRSPAFVASLMSLLGQRDLRESVRHALVGIGGPALAHLGSALADSGQPHAVRRHLPRAIAAFGSSRAAELLSRQLLVEPDGMIRFKILRALGRLRTDNPSVPLDPAILDRAFGQTIGRAFSYMRWRGALARELPPALREPGTASGTLLALLRDKEVHAVERLFRLLNLMTGDEDFARVHRGLESEEQRPRAESRELVEHLVLARYREPLLALVDDLYEAGARRPELLDREDEMDGEAALAQLLDCGVESLQWLAARALTELTDGRRRLVRDGRPVEVDVAIVARAAAVREAFEEKERTR